MHTYSSLVTLTKNLTYYTCNSQLNIFAVPCYDVANSTWTGAKFLEPVKLRLLLGFFSGRSPSLSLTSCSCLKILKCLHNLQDPKEISSCCILNTAATVSREHVQKILHKHRRFRLVQTAMLCLQRICVRLSVDIYVLSSPLLMLFLVMLGTFMSRCKCRAAVLEVAFC